ncbi:hypothetical protein GTW64_28285 [Streptomyces sp. SID4923]|nr:hypothetical protein [Streptomyces sp. SID4923]
MLVAQEDLGLDAVDDHDPRGLIVGGKQSKPIRGSPRLSAVRCAQLRPKLRPRTSKGPTASGGALRHRAR